MSAGLAAAQAQSFDPEARGFWARRYAIPVAYDTYFVRMSTDSPSVLQEEARTLFVSAGGREYSSTTGAASGSFAASLSSASCWFAPSGRVAELQRSLAQLGEVEEFQHADNRAALGGDRPDPSELSFKLDLLSGEWPSFAPFAGKLKAVTGLLDAQTRTTKRLFDDDKVARSRAILVVYSNTPGLVVSKLPQTRCNTPAEWPRLEPGPVLAGITGFSSSGSSDYWKRSGGGPACGAETDAMDLGVFSEKPEKTLRRIEKIIKRRGIVVLSTECFVGETSHVSSEHRAWIGSFRLWVARDDLPAVRDEIGGAGEMIWYEPTRSVGWQRIDGSFAEKFDALKADWESGKDALVGVSGIRSLVRAELERLEPYAKAYRLTNRRRLINVQIYGPWPRKEAVRSFYRGGR